MRKILLLFVAALLAVGAYGYRADEPAGASIDASELAQRIRAGSAPLVLDVRSTQEFERGSVPEAINIPYDELPSRLAELEIAKTQEVVVLCHSGRRAGIAAATLRESGYAEVRDLDGHWQGWVAAGLPTE